MTGAQIAMAVGIIVGLLTILGVVISYLVAMNKMSFFAGQFLAKVDQIGVSFQRFEKSFEKHMEEESVQCSAMWKKMDGHGDTLIEHSQRIGVIEKAIDK